MAISKCNDLLYFFPPLKHIEIDCSTVSICRNTKYPLKSIHGGIKTVLNKVKHSRGRKAHTRLAHIVLMKIWTRNENTPIEKKHVSLTITLNRAKLKKTM